MLGNGEDTMILDVTGVELVPGNFGQECPGNGEHMDIECCCEECDYMRCCITESWHMHCAICLDGDCPRHQTKE